MIEEQNQTIQRHYNILLEWNIPDHDKPFRSKRWYIITGVISVSCFVYALISGNFTFAGIIVMIAFIYAYTEIQEPLIVQCAITDTGIRIGRRLFLYKDLLSFWILYEPDQQINKLYIDFKNTMRPSLPVPLINHDPVEVRELLLQYLPEDPERTDEPLTDVLERVLKL